MKMISEQEMILKDSLTQYIQ